MAQDQGKPTLVTRMAAAFRGEARADELEAYRRAGGLVYTQLERAEELRGRLAQEGVDLWYSPRSGAGQLLCTWSAFVLQSIGEHLLDADYAADPSTVGYVPEVTYRQVAACFAQVEGWVSRARQAESNPGYQVERELELPAGLPAWAEATPCPLPHLRGMLAAARAVREHAEVALGVFEQTVAHPDRHQPDLRRLRQLMAEAATAADYGEGLLDADPGPRMHEEVEERLQRALESYYHLGQLIAMPQLIAGYRGRTTRPAPPPASQPAPRSVPPSASRTAPPPVPPAPPPPPDRRRPFDPWCLTGRPQRAVLQANLRAQQAIKELWRSDPDPAATLRIQMEIDAAFRASAITYATDAQGRQLGSYNRCPWGAIYVARRAVVIGGRVMEALQQFTYEVSAEDLPRTGRFTREIVVSNFSHTSKIVYTTS
ncbi:hypothetical protein GCM10022419_108410 [Nonomuraea rosea]|uniref:Uncharacterized protein n=1 Tax=Nonomuraea rosea TaxID=638574 RepID=A0ABP6ZD90_9ACTN